MSVELIEPIPHSIQKHPFRELLLNTISTALNAVNGEEAVRRNLQLEDRRLWIGGQSYDLPPHRKIALLAVGKAAVAMARGAKASLNERISRGIIVTKALPKGEPSEFPVHLGDHPLPMRRSLQAAKAVERFLKSLKPDEMLLCLISGGASALLTYPRPPLRLREIQKTTQLLLRCGATIHELNTVRKHLEQFKGGGIVRAVKPRPVISLILSDVIGDSLDVIGSGLTTPDPTTFEDAIAILEQYGLRPSLSPLVVEYLQRGREGNVPETMKPSDSAFKKVMNHIIASNRHACEAARLNLQAAGVETFHLTSFLQGEASQVGRVFASFARQLCTSPPDRASPICWIAGGETTVTVRGNGIGGRNLELALGAVTDMNGLDRALLLTLATDGDDGFSHAAGAVVNGETARRAKNLGMSPAEFLRKNDSFSFFSRLQDCIYTSPTHTNVNDLVILFIG